MDNYEIFKIDNDENEYKYNLQINNIHNINIQEEQTKKVDILLDGIFQNNNG